MKFLKTRGFLAGPFDCEGLDVEGIDLEKCFKRNNVSCPSRKSHRQRFFFPKMRINSCALCTILMPSPFQ